MHNESCTDPELFSREGEGVWWIFEFAFWQFYYINLYFLREVQKLNPLQILPCESNLSSLNSEYGVVQLFSPLPFFEKKTLLVARF